MTPNVTPGPSPMTPNPMTPSANPGTPTSPTTPMPTPVAPMTPVADIPDVEGRSLREWVIDLVNDDPKIREKAAARVEQLGLRAEKPLIALTHDPVADVRRGAAFALLKDLHPDESARFAAFVHLLDDPEPRVRGVALQGLASLDGKDLAAQEPHFAKVLADAKAPATLRSDAARALGRIGPVAQGSLKTLVATAEGATDPKLKAAAFAALGKVAPSSPEQLPLARSLLKSGGDEALRRAAIRRLGEIGPAAAPAIDELAAVLADADNSTAKSGADSLVKIGPASVKALMSQLASTNRQVKILAIYALGMIGPPAKEANDALKKLAVGTDELVAQAAVDALARIAGQQ